MHSGPLMRPIGKDVLLSCEYLNDLVIIRSSDSSLTAQMRETTISSERRQTIRH